MSFSDLDSTRLQEALALAEGAIGVSDPNPRVGCVIACANGTTLGTGFTQLAGEAHAEVMALRQAKSSGSDLDGATAWVTLEPCAHHGRTPPCCDALIAAGITRVVIASEDPFPLVAGAGIARLRAAGIDVVMAEGEVVDSARELNIGFFSRLIRKRPWVRVKIAASLDGYTALPDGRSQWITGPAARTDGHAWRKRAGAVLTGLGTVIADDPQLNVRLVESQLQPLRVVVDSQLGLPLEAKLLCRPGKTLVVTTIEDANRRAQLEFRGAEVLVLDSTNGRVDLPSLLSELARRGINELHTEAGSRLNAALIGEDLVDELLIYLAPTLLGAGRPMAAFGALDGLDDAPRFAYRDFALLGEDLRVMARPLGRGDFLSTSTTLGLKRS